MQNLVDKKPSLSVIILAYNEVKSLNAAYKTVLRALKEADILDYEIIISTTVSPAGTHDGTPDLAARIAEENPNISRVHSAVYHGMAHDFKMALQFASKDYVTMVPGSDVFEEDSLTDVFSYLGKAEGIIAHTVNWHVRPFMVRWVSRSFVFLCNLLFFLNIKYYNGIIIFPVKFVKAVPMRAMGGEYAAEITIYLVKSGIEYIEVQQKIRPILHPGRTFTLKNVKRAAKSLLSLFWRINFKRERVDLDALRR